MLTEGTKVAIEGDMWEALNVAGENSVSHITFSNIPDNEHWPAAMQLRLHLGDVTSSSQIARLVGLVRAVVDPAILDGWHILDCTFVLSFILPKAVLDKFGA